MCQSTLEELKRHAPYMLMLERIDGMSDTQEEVYMNDSVKALGIIH